MSRRAWFGGISVVVCLALATTLTPAAAVSARPAVVSSASDRPKVTERPDRVSAMVTATAQKSRVEDLSARTPTTATFANPDGTWTTESYAGVVRSKTDADTWVPVDAAIEKSGKAFEPKAAPFAARFSDGGDKAVGSATTPAGSTITVGWPTRLPVPQVQGEQLTYPDAAVGGDLVVTSNGNGFNYSVVLDDAPAADAPALEYRVPLSFGGAKPIVNADGSIVVKDGKHRVATMTAPVMWDSTPPADGAAPERVPVAASVEGSGDTRTLVLKPDMDYLRDPARTYPVTVDPTVILGVAGDTWVDSLLNQSSQYASPELQVGSNNLGITKTRSFMYFDWTPLYTMPRGVLTSAQVQLSNYQTGNCAGTALRMSRITGAWTEGGVTWGNQPAVTATGSSTSTGSFGASACPAEGVVTFDATAIVNDWINGEWNVGVRISADNEGAASGYRKFRSVENGDPTKAPKMVYTYNAYPSTPTGLTISPGYNGYASSTTPTLSAVVSDPDGGAVRGYFEVKSGSTVVWSGSSDWATSGARVQVTVPSGILNDATTYTVNAYSQDATLKSEVAATKSMPVDVTAPTMTITSSAFTNGTWSTTAPTTATFTLNGTADTGWFDATFDGVSYGSVRADSSGNFVSSAWTVTPGWHTWSIAPIDKAGNRGAATTFSFGAGTGAFATPNPWTETTSSFPVQMTAPPNATGATLQWQVVGETTWHTATQITSSGSPWTGSVTTSNGHSATPSLVWKATGEPLGTGTLKAPALVVIKGCFQYASAADSCTTGWPIILTTSARGGNYPEAQVGPASVALYTGEATISDVDAADSKAGLGRTFSAFDDSTLTPGLFGPGWSDPSVLAAPSADAKAQVIDNRSKDGSFVIVDPDSGSQAFRLKPNSTTEYLPVHPTGDATKLTFTPGSGGALNRLELSRPLGSAAVVTTWTLKPSDTGGDPEWTVDTVDAPGTTTDITVASAAGSQRPVWIRESDPSASSTCTATTQTAGCRGLRITYTGTGAATRVSGVDRVIGAATQAEVVTKTLATYTYDTSGKLTTVCSAAPAAGKPALCVNYAYTTVNGRTLLSQITPPGLKPWRFTYDSIARLTAVKREKPAGGDATWSVDYSLTPASSGLPDLTASTAAQWGQSVIPTKVFAVYEPFTGTADVTKANLYYTTATGTTTNTATYGPSGWLVDTSWYDAKGNEVQHLDSTGWARVQAAAVANRPSVASDASSYTVYNTWGGTDVAGTRVVDEYGPAHTASLKNGTIGLFRTHTHTMYDDDPNADTALITASHGSNGLGLVVKTTTSTSDPTRTIDYDTTVTKYGYEPIVTGDGNGWTLGSPTTVSTQVDANTWSTQTNRFDNAGRQIETRQPGGAEDASHAGADAHSTKTTYYTAVGTGACGGKPAWDGLVCKIEPADQPTGPTIPTTYNAAFNEDLQPVTVQETSSGDTRTTSTSYDALGRPTDTTKATTGSGVTDETIATSYGYDDATGLQTTTTSGGQAVTTGYDTWGRQTTYTDALGTASSTAFDAAGNVATFNDGTATYSYSYDSHSNLTSVDAGGGVGAYTYSYATNGSLDAVAYPNGVLAARTYDEIGNQTGLTYRQGSTALLAFSATQTAEGRTIAASSPASAQGYTYDRLGRLIKVEDTHLGGCVTRTYGFDQSSNRTSFGSYAPAMDGGCQSTNATATRLNTYDSAGRIRNTGYAYDTLGRTVTTPQADAGSNAAGALASSYHADDMVATLSHNVLNSSGGTDTLVMTYGLDPAERINAITRTTNGDETQRLRYRFADMGDSPASIDTSTNGGTTWTATRYVTLPGLGAAASSSAGATTLQLANLHGDLVATMDATSGSTGINSYAESDEYGNSEVATVSARYGWLGSRQRSTDAVGGVTLMGVRVYNPATGLFATPDPILGGNVTAYTYPVNPIDQFDLDGRECGPCKKGSLSREYFTGYSYGSWHRVIKGSGFWHDGLQALSWIVTFSYSKVVASMDWLKIQTRVSNYVRYDCVKGYWRPTTYSKNLKYRWKAGFSIYFWWHPTYTTSWQSLW